MNENRLIKLQRNDCIEVTIDNIGINGEGVARYNGMAIFIKGALPSEKIRAKVILVKQGYAIAIVEEIIMASKYRVKPLCPVFGKCGGCSLQHLAYDQQLKYKQNKVKETFAKVSGLNVEVDAPMPSALVYGYRNKLSLPVRGADAQVGFFASSSHRIVPINECAIEFELNKKIIKLFREFMTQNSLTGYDEETQKGDVRHLVVRVLSGMTFIAVVSPRATLPPLKAFGSMLEKEFGNRYALYHNINAKPTNVILGEVTKFISGNTEPIIVDGLKIKVHPASFFQVNDYIRSKIYDIVVAEASGVVLECYSGSSVLSALMSKNAKKIVAIELDPKAVAAANEMLNANNIQNVSVICGDCQVEVAKAVYNLNGVDTVVLDPPRTGCEVGVLTAISASRCKKIVYVSCNPATLARDCKVLTESGYKLKRVAPLDMFPNTMEVETIAVLVK